MRRVFNKIAISVAALYSLGSFGVLGAEDRVVVNAVGDIMLGGSTLETFKEKGYDYPFGNTAHFLKEGDVNFANLETPITEGGDPFPGKQFTFQMNPRAASSLARAGFNLFSLANNHIMDFGAKGLADTISALKGQGISFAGAGKDASGARAPGVLRVKGKTVALLAYSLAFPAEFYATKERPGTAFAFKEDLDADIRGLRKVCDILVVSFHWGKELSQVPETYQVTLAHQAIDLGADLVLGHHPHVLQGIEIYQAKAIFYSLGNFAFSSYSDNVQDGIIARITLSAGRTDKIEIIPLNVFNPEVDVRPEVLSGEEAEGVVDALSEISKRFGTVVEFKENRGWVKLR